MNLTAGTRTVTLPSSQRIAALGQGTWHMAEDRGGERRRSRRCASASISG